MGPAFGGIRDPIRATSLLESPEGVAKDCGAVGLHSFFAAATPARSTPGTQGSRAGVPVLNPVGGDLMKEQGAAGKCRTSAVPRREMVIAWVPVLGFNSPIVMDLISFICRNKQYQQNYFIIEWN